MSDLYAGKPCPEMLDYLLHRRSIKDLIEPGPDDVQIETILRAASRVPDHGRLCPWYYIVLRGEARREAGELLGDAWQNREPDASPAKLELERERFLRAPMVIAVISAVRPSKKPEWEQVMSAGASCMNLILAANALGFGTVWLTEWYSYDTGFLKKFGIVEGDRVAGFIYIGTPAKPLEERERPVLDRLVTYWHPDVAIRRG